MTDKELAVQLYSSYLQAQARIIASAIDDNKLAVMPTVDQMVDTVQEITQKLSHI